MACVNEQSECRNNYQQVVNDAPCNGIHGCGGTGHIQCHTCGGTGAMIAVNAAMQVKIANFALVHGRQPPCRTCGGSGELQHPRCHGTGIYRSQYYVVGPHQKGSTPCSNGDALCMYCGTCVC
jgi:hypothetical protein